MTRPHRLRVLVAALVAQALAVADARAATLRPFGTLSGPMVAVSDLWDDAGAVAAIVLGPAPAPGERIVVEASQLTAIARQFGVAWRPGSGAVRSILERPGAPVPQDRVQAALRLWLNTAGAPPGAIELTGFEPPLVAPDAAAAMSVEQCSWDPAGSRFAASLAMTGPAMGTMRMRVSGRVVAMAQAMLAASRLAPGTLLTSADLAPGEVPLERLHGPAVSSSPQAVGLVLRHALAQGEPVLLANLALPLMVTKGRLVAIAIDADGVSLTATGEALQSGALDERIAVRNPTSRAVLLARVTGPGAVRVDPGSLPMQPASPGSGGGAAP